MPTHDKPYLPPEFLVRHAAEGARAGHGEFPRLVVAGLGGLSWGIKINGFRTLDVGPQNPVRVFESSGTSAQGRSRSRFSEAGLTAYQTAITAGFFSALQRLGDLPAESARRMPGISLVPPPAQWPTSSLAAMTGWLGEQTRLAYCRTDEENALDRAVKEAGQSPLWIFGTAFHLIPLLDRGKLPRLPRGSFVIYTGGTKGRAREVGEGVLMEGLAHGFGLPEEAVISEYGMSELASAAYTVFTGAERKLLFQEGAIPFVVNKVRRDADGLCYEGTLSGTGLLGIVDLNRVDLAAPVITEDVVSLRHDGTFSLIGRARLAPLKGCSLLAEEVGAKTSGGVSPGARFHPESSPYRRGQVTVPAPACAPKPNMILRTLINFLESPEATDSLSADIGSKRAAELALADALHEVTGLTPDSLTAAVNRSGAPDLVRRAWEQGMAPSLLMIPPNTHPLALPMPLTLALGAGLIPTIRLPRSQERRGSFTRGLIRHFQMTGAEIRTLDSSFRLGGEQEGASGFASVLIFGEDQTITEIKQTAGPALHVAGHGGALAASVVTWAELSKMMDHILADSFALMQDGCMASRMLGIVVPQGIGEGEVERTVASSLAASWWRFWREPLPPLHAGGLLSRGLVSPAPGLPAVSVHQHPVPAAFGPQLSVTLIPARNDPHGAAAQAVEGWISQWPELRLVTASPELLWSLERGFAHQIDVRPLGQANRPAWNGLHFGEPVFSGSC